MNRQSIVIDREYGSGGREVARILSEQLGIEFYDGNLLVMAGEEYGINLGTMADYDERGVGSFLFDFATIGSYGHNVGINEAPFQVYSALSRLVQQLVAKKPCIFLGRCTAHILETEAHVPFVNAFNFLRCPIERLVDEGESMGIAELFRSPLFWLLALLMVCSGASEISMSQWASAFTESALGVSKTVGDLAGPCLFAVLMGLTRVFYSKNSAKLDLTRLMPACALLCIGCYLLASLAPWPILGLTGCALCGVSVGVMWPGTLSISAQRCPRGGTAMFALLALGGDLGGSLGPALVGAVSGAAGGSLKPGLLAAAVFPVLLIVGLHLLKRSARP